MRISGGEFRGRPLFTHKGQDVRPTSDKVRQAFFNIIGDAVDGARFLDLFGGTGAMGLEAISRGAAMAVIVEKDHAGLVIKNAAHLGLDGDLRLCVIRADAFAALDKFDREGPAFDIIYADPPWKMDILGRIAAMSAKVLSGNGLLVLEAYYKTPAPEGSGLALADERRYGDTVLYFYKPGLRG
jgi:16S rRNA (guanine(966)-N(2))-methyltransferase RsmD